MFCFFFSWVAGSPRVEGDDEEEGIDDLENEFEFGINNQGDPRYVAEAMLSSRLNVGRGSHPNASCVSTPLELDSSSVTPEIPLLTYGEEVKN